jgi:malate dehydrogenase (oxaloacetate-decarboxylating)
VYLGWRHRRIGKDEYFEFVHQFVQAVRAELPDVLLQWEDFATPHAQPILDRYRDQLLTFNDDIQGTASVALAALTAGVTSVDARLSEQRIVMVGAGSAGIGVCEQVVRAMVSDGLSETDARARVCVVDVAGLLSTDRTDLDAAQRRLAQPPGAVTAGGQGSASLLDVVQAVGPTALIGLSTATGAFTEQVVRAMAERVDRPIIMPLSNPTSRSEARPQDLADWTGGRALVATGSPFPSMKLPDGSEMPVAQCNNVYVFPGIGLVVTAVAATRVTDSMLTVAAAAVADLAPIHDGPTGALLPSRAQLPEVADNVARAVARAAVRHGVAPRRSDQQIDEAIKATRWNPTYA